MTLADYKAYGEQIATRSLELLHSANNRRFTVFTVEDALTELKNIKSPCLVAELPRISFSDSGSDNIHSVMRGAFLIVKKCKQGDSNQIIAAYEEMFLIATDICSKILNDRKRANETGRPAPEKLVKHLVVNEMGLVDVGPVFDGYYGWRIEFPFQSTINLELDETKWNSEIKFAI